jgi:hypothetical protein
MKNILFLIVLFVPSSLTLAANDRVYLEIDPMNTPVRAIELRNFNTVGDAASYYVARIGYTFTTAPPAPIDASFIADLPIRPSAIVPSIMPLQEVLVNMVGEQYVLVIDRLNRRVSFAPIEEKKFVKASSIRHIFIGRYIVTDPRL